MSLYGAIDKKACDYRVVTSGEAALNQVTVDTGFGKADCIFISALANSAAGSYEAPVGIAWSGNTLTFAFASLDAGDFVSYMIVGRNQ